MGKEICVIELCQKGKFAFIVSGIESPEFQLWDTTTRACVDKKNFESGRLTSFKVIDDSIAMIECRDMTMKWSQEKGFYDMAERYYQNDAVWQAVGEEYYESPRISPDGYRRFIWSEDDKTLSILDVTGNQIIASINHTEPVKVAAFHPYGRLIVWASNDNFLRLWNLEESKIVTKWQTRGQVTACSVTKEELIICGDNQGYVYLVDTPFVPGRVGSSHSNVTDQVNEILNVMGEQKNKVVGFIKEKMDSTKDSKVVGFIKEKMGSTKDIIDEKLRPFWKKSEKQEEQEE